ncbi:MAG TPA: antitoxin family protein [Pyrinomonadaceae bacterium]|nr:antitoxin family protein [Pyrinomonadaceae bacterium]
MQQVIKTTFRNGVFVPHAPVNLPEGAEVEIRVERATGDKLPLTDEEREKIMAELLENMKSNPIPPEAPRKFTREELHERR